MPYVNLNCHPNSDPRDCHVHVGVERSADADKASAVFWAVAKPLSLLAIGGCGGAPAPRTSAPAPLPQQPDAAQPQPGAPPPPPAAAQPQPTPVAAPTLAPVPKRTPPARTR